MARLALIATLVAVVAACGPARESARRAGDSPVVVTRRSPSEVATKVVGGTPKERQILVDALAGIGDTKIDKIEVAPAEKGWVDDLDAVGLGFSAGAGELDMLSEWQSWLVTQALAVRSNDLGLPVVAYLGGRGMGQSSVGKASPKAPRVAATEAEIKKTVQRIEAAARDANAKVDEIQILEPLGLAVAITLRVSDPAQFLDNRVEEFFTTLGGPPDGPEAGDNYLRVVDEKGDRIMELAGASVGGGSSGTSWVRPDLLGCYYPAISRPMDWEPPPCPTGATSAR
jgi:hypothetical protein